MITNEVMQTVNNMIKVLNIKDEDLVQDLYVRGLELVQCPKLTQKMLNDGLLKVYNQYNKKIKQKQQIRAEEQDLEQLMKSIYTMDRMIELACLSEEINKLLNNSNLSDNMRKIVIQSYGLDDGVEAKNTDIAKALGTSQQYVVNCKHRALIKLRECTNVLDSLKEFL